MGNEKSEPAVISNITVMGEFYHNGTNGTVSGMEEKTQSDDPYGHLAASALVFAIDDWRRTRVRMAKSGKKKGGGVINRIKWFWSETAEVMLGLCGMDPDFLRETLCVPTIEEYENGTVSWELTDLELYLVRKKQETMDAAFERQKERVQCRS